MANKKKLQSKEEKAKQKFRTEANKERRRKKHLEHFPGDKQAISLYGGR